MNKFLYLKTTVKIIKVKCKINLSQFGIKVTKFKKCQMNLNYQFLHQSHSAITTQELSLNPGNYGN